MELAAVFLLSLLGGYTFALVWRFTAFAMRRAEGHHLYFRAAYYGAGLFLLSFLIRFVLLSRLVGYEEFEQPLLNYINDVLKEPSRPHQAEIVVVAGYSMFLGPLFGLLCNFITSKTWTIGRNLSALDTMLWRGQTDGMPVSLTLTNSKVYVGLVVRITDPERPPAMVTLLPMYSGHRTEDGRMELTTAYDKIYETFADANRESGAPTPWDQELENFHIAIRADAIVTATIFSPRAYSMFNPGWDATIGKPKRPAPQELLVEIKHRTMRNAPEIDEAG